MLPVRLFAIALLAVALPAYAQEEPVAAAGKVLSNEDSMEFEQRITSIAIKEEAYAHMSQELTHAEGLQALLLRERLDSIWVTTFNESVKLAQELLAKREQGFDVSELIVHIAPRLREFPKQSEDAIERLRTAVVFSTDEPSAPKRAIKDQQLRVAVRKIDSVFQSLVSYLGVAEKMGIDDNFSTDALSAEIQYGASLRSAFLHLSIENAAVLRAAAGALPNDTDVAAQLAVADARVRIASAALQSSVDLMRELNLDSRKYSQQVVSSTGKLTSDVLDFDLLAEMATEWSDFVAKFVKREGPSALFKLLIIFSVLVVFFYLRRLVARLTSHALKSSRVRVSALLHDMITASVGNFVMFLGILIALSQVGITLGPLLAGLGIAGFIIGFALQDTLSNFASGMLILLYRPFDVGDLVTSGTYTGKVSSMSLVNTTFKTIDNQMVVVPNNMIWKNAIINVTAQRTRRVDLVINVSYSDDMDKVEKILTDIVVEHPLVLDKPEPVIKLHEFAESSIVFVCRPWVKTDDYWDTYWDILRAIKVRFDAEGITIPFPQRDVHHLTDGSG